MREGHRGELGRPCPVVCCRGAYLQLVWLLRRCAPLSAQRCGVGGSSRKKKKKEAKKEKGGIQNGIFNHLRGAAVRVPLAAFRRICPTLDPAALWLTQMRKRVFLKSSNRQPLCAPRVSLLLLLLLLFSPPLLLTTSPAG